MRSPREEEEEVDDEGALLVLVLASVDVERDDDAAVYAALLPSEAMGMARIRPGVVVICTCDSEDVPGRLVDAPSKSAGTDADEVRPAVCPVVPGDDAADLGSAKALTGNVTGDGAFALM